MEAWFDAVFCLLALRRAELFPSLAAVPNSSGFAAERFSLSRARLIARERMNNGFSLLAFRTSDLALGLASSERLPSGETDRLTPGRGVLDSPAAIPSCGDRAPWFPWRVGCNSSRINSPDWVLGDFLAWSFFARFKVSCSGISLCHALADNSPSGDELYDQNDKREHEQNVDEASERVAAYQAQKPENEQDQH
jgi:hypothetical protein